MSEPEASGARGLLTLSEVSKRTKISMPTLQRYKKEYQKRIPSVGQGRKQRYPEESLEVFQQIKQENVGRRGRPRKAGKAGKAAKPPARGRKARATKGAGRGRKAAAKPARAAKSAKSKRGRPKGAASGGLLTLTEISKRTRISYPTLVRYVKLYLKRIPHEGSGRRRRFHPEAVEVFNELRSQSGRGRRAGGGRGRKAVGRPAGSGRAAAAADGSLGRRVRSLEKSHSSLEKQIKALIKQLKKPVSVTISPGR